MSDTQANSQVLDADGQVLFRQVTINGVPYWQAQSGRTFPVIAGAEDGDGDANNGEQGDDAEQDSADNYDKERGFKKIQAQAADLKKLKAEREALRLQAKELAALKAKDQERADAEKSELEKAQTRLAEREKAHQESEAKLKRLQISQAIERAARKHNARSPEIVAKLIDQAALEFDDAGEPTNAEDLVKALLKAETYLVGTGNGTNGVPGTPRGAGAVSHDEQVTKNREELRASPHYQPLG